MRIIKLFTMLCAVFASQAANMQRVSDHNFFITIPGLRDKAFIHKQGNNYLSTHPDAPRQQLPRGFYFLEQASATPINTPEGPRRPVFTVTNGKRGAQAFVWSPRFKQYVAWRLVRNPKTGALQQKAFAIPAAFNPPADPWPKNPATAARVMAAMPKKAPFPPMPPTYLVPVYDRATRKTITMIRRNALFNDIMGMTEQEFKNRVGHPAGDLKPDPKAVSAWIRTHAQNLINATHGRARAINQPTWSEPTLNDLRTRVRQKLIAHPITQFGSLAYSFHNSAQPKNTDIRALHEQYPNAFFQIASNFNALEGFMGDYSQDLSRMNHGPVQGEEAVMATMPAAIYRRYVLPRINLLSNLNSFFTVNTPRNSTPVITGAVSKAIPTPAQLGGLKVGVHRNIAVASGYNDDNATVLLVGGKRRIPAYNKWMDLKNPLRVSHIYTAAHNINLHHRKDIQLGNAAVNTIHRAIARTLLIASYEATVLAAIDAGARTLILTMLGAGAFGNDPLWIVEALQRLEDVIIASGMNVILIIRHENPVVQNSMLVRIQHIIRQIKIREGIYTRNKNLLTRAINYFFQYGQQITLQELIPQPKAPKAQPVYPPPTGATINGRRYTAHALERMAPNTPQVRQELERRALAKGLKRGSLAFNNEVQPRDIAPEVVEAIIRGIPAKQGNQPGRFMHVDNKKKIVVVTESNGTVITVYRFK
jgi:hypothetical protein